MKHRKWADMLRILTVKTGGRTMKEIAKKLSDLYDQMLLRHDKLNAERAENAEALAANKSKTGDLNARAKEIAVLEKKYKDKLCELGMLSFSNMKAN